jgi:hypothetical protein
VVIRIVLTILDFLESQRVSKGMNLMPLGGDLKVTLGKRPLGQWPTGPAMKIGVLLQNCYE